MASIYLVLDMENDLVHEDGPNGKGPYGQQVQLRQIIAKTANALKKARAAGVKVGYVKVGFSNDYGECPPNSPIFSAAKKNGLFKLGTWGTEIHPAIAPEIADFQIIKHRVSPFYSTSLEALLRANQITRIYCSGISTNAVVQSTLREGHDRDYQMVLLEDCCCALSEEEHVNSINGLRRFCTITTSVDVCFE
jgi:nicotinamidase-related amidase